MSWGRTLELRFLCLGALHVPVLLHPSVVEFWFRFVVKR